MYKQTSDKQNLLRESNRKLVHPGDLFIYSVIKKNDFPSMPTPVLSVVQVTIQFPEVRDCFLHLVDVFNGYLFDGFGSSLTYDRPKAPNQVNKQFRRVVLIPSLAFVLSLYPSATVDRNFQGITKGQEDETC